MTRKSYERLIKIEEPILENPEESSYNDNGFPKDNNHQQLSSLIPVQSTQQTIHKVQKNKFHTGYSFEYGGSHYHIRQEHYKYISLVTLTIQNAALNLTMRAARTQKEQFSSAVAVTVSEILKFLTCFLIICHQESPQSAIVSFRRDIIGNYRDTLMVAVPALVYYIQNNLIYIGCTHLDAATAQITYQLKILTTAIFSVVLLGRKLTKFQWMSLFVLFVGVSTIEALAIHQNTSSSSENSTLNVSGTNDHSHKDSDIIDNRIQNHGGRKENAIIGILSLLVATCMSGFAGVYFEKILKNTSQVSLWFRNVQLSMASIPFGILTVIFLDESTMTKGIFHGFTSLTWFCIVLQVGGGLLTALVVKYANNISKGFATSLAIVISTFASIILFDFQVTFSFLLGASLVVASVMMYNSQ